MPTYTHLITLRPIDKFFFGSENTFNTADGGKSNYLVASRYFPQQTTLLGMLRLELLLQNGLLADVTDKLKDTKAATTLIGNSGFSLYNAIKSNYTEEVKGWGVIQNISPVFLQNGNENYFVAPNDFRFALQTQAPGSMSLGFGETATEPVPFYPEYDAKKMNETLLLSNRLSEKGIDKVFIERQQVGIKKNSDEEGYFKQTHYTLAKGFAFAFYTNLNLPEEKHLNGGLIPMGGERSVFKMEITPLKDKNVDLSAWNISRLPKSSLSKIYLLTDAFVPTDLSDCCAFAYNSTVSFRQIETSISHTNNFWDMNNKQDRHTNRNGKAVKSQLYNFFSRGSVFYAHPDKLTDLQNAFKLPALQQVGYNHFITIQNH
jgi:CRISPR-associated protein Cmr3